MSEDYEHLKNMREHLQEQLWRNQDKGGSTITLTEEDCAELFKVMKQAELCIYDWLGEQGEYHGS